MTRTAIDENALSGLFSATLSSCFSHIARYAPSLQAKTCSKSATPALTFFVIRALKKGGKRKCLTSSDTFFRNYPLLFSSSRILRAMS